MTLIYGHRGACALLPENTLPSFERALDDGANALESDVHLTRDGHVVLSHDSTGRRMANISAAISSCDLDEVQSWDVGWGFEHEGERPFVGEGYRIPSLEEMLGAFPEVRLNLDVKQSNPSMVASLLSTLRRAGAEHRVTLASFHQGVLKELRKAQFSGTLALGVREMRMLLTVPRSMLTLRKGLGHRAQIPTHWGPVRFDSNWFMGKCEEVGIKVDFWTINDAAEARRLVELGAAGIMTDNPAIIKLTT
ncbi:MAG: hypothetical protein GY822_11405 [Deltaproteobacteria bacterium]|nr:hypothetical protein [Deltaproteobacteria bacterium]